MIVLSQELGAIISGEVCSPVFHLDDLDIYNLCKVFEPINVSLGSFLSHSREQSVPVSEWGRMDAKSNDNMRLVPILVGVGVVAASAMLAKIILDQRKKVLHHDLHRTVNGL